MTDVTEARAAALKSLAQAAEILAAANDEAGKKMIGSKDQLSDEQHMKEVSASQKVVTDKFSQFMLSVEHYPNLRAADNFLVLQDQLEGAENRINIARMAFNDSAKEFNASIRRIPGSLMAGFGNFKRKAYFEADAGAEKAPQVNFGK
jgi:LemA protein